MAETKEYDITIIGGGPGGYVGAIRASQLGARVALVEKDRLGGTCLNRGCIPTKALAKAVEVLAEAKHAAEYGVKVSSPTVDFRKMMERKNTVVNNLVSGIEGLMKAGAIDVYKGAGRLVSPARVAVVGQELKTKKVVLATGSVPARIPVPGLDLPGVVTSDDILNLTELPKSLVIIGGGVIGMEFASIFGALGTKITVVEMLPAILPPCDEELARRYHQMARSQGIDINVSAKVKGVRQGQDSLEVVFDTAKGESVAPAQMVLVAVGRSPYTEGLGLAEVGVTMNRRAIAANEHLETNLPGVYAIGDAIGGIMLAHVASHEGEVAVENALGRRRKADYSAVPGCIFTNPEIADVGLSEKEAKDKGIPHKVSKFPFSASGRAQTMGEAQGLVKMICEEGSGKVLGVHILGPRATDLIAEAALAVRLGVTAKDLAHTIHAHPTLPETVMEAAMAQLDGAIHVRRM
ncbi:MAG: dihydrolipoyl dehydrogenase [Chloroflexi bacterium]|nr:dihydrolipoyl dehydrogenase [Chloroflexota bacterium]